jgi:hypothetical protein
MDGRREVPKANGTGLGNTIKIKTRGMINAQLTYGLIAITVILLLIPHVC